MSAVSDVSDEGADAVGVRQLAEIAADPRRLRRSTAASSSRAPCTCVRCAEIVLGMASVRNWSDACATTLLGSATIEAMPSAVVAAGRSSWVRCAQPEQDAGDARRPPGPAPAPAACATPGVDARVRHVVGRRRRSQPAQIDRHLFRRLVAVLGVALETLHDDALELRIEAGLQCGRRRQRRVQDRVGQPPGLRFVERPPAGRHLVEHDAERVDVRARVNRLATHLLGRHVRQRPLEPARPTASSSVRRRRRCPTTAPGRSPAPSPGPWA